MKVLVKRNQQVYGPYPVPALQLYLERGTILPNDLARLETETEADWRSLARLMRRNKIDSPVLSAVPRPADLLREFRSLDPRLLLPWDDIRSGRWLKDRRVLLFVAVGMLPILVVCVGPSVGLIYWCLSFYSSALWAIFFLQMFRTPEVTPKVAALCFGATAVAIPLVMVVQLLPPLTVLYELARGHSVLPRLVGQVLGVGLVEETCKAGVVYYAASRPGRLLLPQTVVLYGLISGLGFGCVEGVLYQQGVNRQAPADAAYFLNVLRLTSLPFLHAVWAGISAYFIGFSMIVPRKRAILRVVAILIPATFHGAYNTFSGGPLGLIPATLSVFFLMSYLASCKEFKAHLDGPRSP